MLAKLCINGKNRFKHFNTHKIQNKLQAQIWLSRTEPLNLISHVFSKHIDGVTESIIALLEPYRKNIAHDHS